MPEGVTESLGGNGDEPTQSIAPGGAALREGPGTTIGPYKLLQLIGEGGFGSVFMAQQERPVTRKVALKIIKLGMDTRQVIARFEAERQALALMDHPNIARVLDAGATETGRPFFVMELVKGEPIVEYCDRNNLSIQDRLELFAQVCTAVQHAHTKGIIHRDLKPSNVLVSTQDGHPHAKVIDFGIAKATASKLTEKTLFTEHKQLIGTPEYMSPEQAEGSLDIDTRTDVYSLGVLLYELLTGTTPFSGKELRSAAYAEIQRIIREVEPPKPSTRLSHNTDALASVAAHRHTEPRKLGTAIRGELDWIVMKALEKDRQRRYETANGLAMDLQRYLAGEAVLAAPPSTAYRLRKFVRRNRATVIAGSLVAAALLLGLAGTAWQAKVASDRAAAATKAEGEAKAARDAEKSRADELKKVSDFQEKMLAQVDPTAAGLKLTADVNRRFAAALEKAKVPEAERPGLADEFRRDWGRLNATDAAKALIDETILKPAVKAIDEQFKDQPVIDAQLRQALAERYGELGLYEEALPLKRAALDTRRRVLGEEHTDTLTSINSMGSLLIAQGKLAEAEPYIREALEKRRRMLGEEHPDTLMSIALMGHLLQTQGKLAEAEPYHLEALEKRRRVLGEEHLDTITSINNFGWLRRAQGRSAEAEGYYREAAEKGRRVLGEEHPVTLHFINNIGDVLEAQGKYAEAETYFREALEKRRRVLGEEHPDTTSSISRIGLLLQAQGKLAEAEPYLREALEKSRRVLGEEHPWTLQSINNMGFLLQAQGKLAEAEPFYREALEKRRRVLGEEHPWTLQSINNMGLLLQAQGKPAEAEPYYREALEKRRRVLGEEHPDTLQSISNMGFQLQAQGKLAEAEPYVREAMEKKRRVLGDEHPDTLISISNMGMLLRDQDKLAEAEPYVRESLEKRRRVLGEEHPDTITSINNMGWLLQAQGKLPEAEAYYREAIEKDRRVRGAEHQATLGHIYNLGRLLLQQGRPQEAVDLIAPNEPTARKVFTGANVRGVALMLTILGRSRAALPFDPASFTLAEAELLEAHPIYVKTRGEMHKDTLVCVQGLIDLYTAWDKAELGKGYDAKAAEWKAKLDALTAPAPAPDAAPPEKK